MLTETVAQTILTASITGAGLIMAIYALITPMARKIFEKRVELHRKKKKKFDKMKEKINEESSYKDFKQLKMLAMDIKEIKMFPRYLKYVVLVFFGYILTAVFDTLWLTSPSQQDSITQSLITFLFILSTVGFLFIGIIAIFDIQSAMKREYEQVKKEKEEVEENSKEIERIKKVAEQIRKQAEIVEKWKET